MAWWGLYWGIGRAQGSSETGSPKREASRGESALEEGHVVGAGRRSLTQRCLARFSHDRSVAVVMALSRSSVSPPPRRDL